MSIRKNAVLLLKSQRTGDTVDKYEELLKYHNFEVNQVKTLVFDYKNIGKFREKLLNSNSFSGLILSSPRCVNAVALALNTNEISEKWGNKSNWVVGETTHSEALKLGLDCQGKESGNAENLSKLILNYKSQLKRPFLFPHGNLKTDTLSIELGRHHITVEGVLVYDTISNPEIGNELGETTRNFKEIPEFVVFFSPSGLRSSLDYLRRVPVGLSSVKLIAIGPVTETALKDEHLRVFGVAKSPNPDEILNVIKQGL